MGSALILNIANRKFPNLPYARSFPTDACDNSAEHEQHHQARTEDLGWRAGTHFGKERVPGFPVLKLQNSSKVYTAL